MVHRLAHSAVDDSVYYNRCGIAGVYAGLEVSLVVRERASWERAL